MRHRSDALLALRKDAGRSFRQNMEHTLACLGLPNSQIAFHIEPMKDISADGSNGIELYFSANMGEEMQPLAKIASGGEVSRIALALKTVDTDKREGRTVILTKSTSASVARLVYRLQHISGNYATRDKYSASLICLRQRPLQTTIISSIKRASRSDGYADTRTFGKRTC